MNYGRDESLRESNLRQQTTYRTIQSKKKENNFLDGFVGFLRTALTIGAVGVSLLGGPAAGFVAGIIEAGANIGLTLAAGQRLSPLGIGIDVLSVGLEGRAVFKNILKQKNAFKFISNELIQEKRFSTNVFSKIKEADEIATEFSVLKRYERAPKGYNQFQQYRNIFDPVVGGGSNEGQTFYSFLRKSRKQYQDYFFDKSSAVFNNDADKIIAGTFGRLYKDNNQLQKVKEFLVDKSNKKLLGLYGAKSFNHYRKNLIYFNKNYKDITKGIKTGRIVKKKNLLQIEKFKEIVLRGSYAEDINRINEFQKVIKSFRDIPLYKRLTDNAFLNAVREAAEKANNTNAYSVVESIFDSTRFLKKKHISLLKSNFFPNNILNNIKGDIVWRFLPKSDKSIILAHFNSALYIKRTPQEIGKNLDVIKENLTPRGWRFIYKKILKNDNAYFAGLPSKFVGANFKDLNLKKEIIPVLDDYYRNTNKLLYQERLPHRIAGDSYYSPETQKKLAYYQTEGWNDRVQLTSSLFSSSDGGRNIAEYLSKKVRKVLDKRFLRGKNLTKFKKLAIKAAKADNKIGKIRKAFAKSGGSVIVSEYLLGYKIIDPYYKSANANSFVLDRNRKLSCLMHFNPITTKSKTGKNKNSKPPHSIQATLEELENLNIDGSSYWWAVGQGKGWFKDRGGRKSIVAEYSGIGQYSYFLNFIPINAWRRSASLFSNAINSIGNDDTAIWNIHKKAYWNSFTDSLVRVGASRVGRIVARYIVGGLIKKRYFEKALKSTKFRSKAIQFASQKTFWTNRLLQKGSSVITQSAGIKVDKNFKIRTKFNSKRGRGYGSTLLNKTFKQSLPTLARSAAKRKIGRHSSYNLQYSRKRKFKQVRRVWSAFTPNQGWDYGNLRKLGL